jgi:hypothetical protein
VWLDKLLLYVIHKFISIQKSWSFFITSLKLEVVEPFLLWCMQNWQRKKLLYFKKMHLFYLHKRIWDNHDLLPKIWNLLKTMLCIQCWLQGQLMRSIYKGQLMGELLPIYWSIYLDKKHMQGSANREAPPNILIYISG